MERLNEIIYYEPENQGQLTLSTRPINIVFLTSIRDVGTCDLNGSYVETGEGVQYMEGAVERTVNETHPLVGRLHGLIRVAGVITDDTPKDMRDSSYGVLPDQGRDWIYPYSLANADGELIRGTTFNIPSDFRLLPLNDAEGRRQRKEEFEFMVLQKMQELGADVLVSDHYMAKLDHLINGWGLYGKVINIHPAVTLEGHPYCFRGKTPTADAIERARQGIDTWTGSTLHIINKTIDEGPPIAFAANTPVYPTDEPQWLRYRNYQTAKLPVFIAGLAHYATRIYPNLDRIELSKLRPTVAEGSLIN